MTEAPFIFRILWPGIISLITVLMIVGSIGGMLNSKKYARFAVDGQRVTVRTE